VICRGLGLVWDCALVCEEEEAERDMGGQGHLENERAVVDGRHNTWRNTNITRVPVGAQGKRGAVPSASVTTRQGVLPFPPADVTLARCMPCEIVTKTERSCRSKRFENGCGGSHWRVRFHLHGNAVSAPALSAFSRAKMV
jgi:hypothetical protein